MKNPNENLLQSETSNDGNSKAKGLDLLRRGMEHILQVSNTASIIDSQLEPKCIIPSESSCYPDPYRVTFPEVEEFMKNKASQKDLTTN